MQLHLSEVQLGPHQADHGSQRQEAHPNHHQGERGEDDGSQQRGRRHYGEPRQHAEGRAAQAAPDPAPTEAASAAIPSQAKNHPGYHNNHHHDGPHNGT